MDIFYLQMQEQPIQWINQSKSTCSSKELDSKEFDWNNIEFLYQECQQQDQASNVTNIIKSSQDSEFNLKIDRLVRTNNQSSLSEVNENEATLEINEDQKEKSNELPQKPVLKRSNTSYRGHTKSFSQVIYEQEKFKRYRNNKRSARTLSMVSLKRSLMTPLLKTSLQKNLKQISINYFNSEYSKTLYVDKNILACELIVLALQEYKKTSDFDQGLLKHSNFTLAYQLTSLEDCCDFSGYPSFQDSIIDIQMVKQDSNQQFQYIFDDVEMNSNKGFFQLELNQKVNFKNLTLNIADISNFGLDLFTVEMIHKNYPTSIILLLEDITNEIFYNLKFEEYATIQEIYNQLQKKGNLKYNQNECFFFLKYPCVNFNNEVPLDSKFPISLLPIHWLIIQFKISSKNVNDQIKISGFGVKSLKSISSSMIQKEELIDQKNLQMFNYEEFKVIKIENNGQQNEVIIGIDYFDFYYYYTSQKQQKYSFYKIAKWMVQFLLENHQSGQTKDYKRIQISSILQVRLKNAQLLIIKYLKNEDSIKKIQFMLPKNNNEVDKMKIQEQPVQIKNIVEKLQYIIQERRKNNYTQ
ncbi:unnamed protein product [Paramecium pentaurelia]|uniref:Uncharacterized protein n=1 Tax=Paramecium pentaurelia TaxID=43138 RepID=A0A8S1S3Z7_9CILI|nr:unnamed protein product [Paramecium pentaurelia]